jgi:hypothetical protein
VDIEVTMDPTPIRATITATNVADANLYITHHSAGPGAYHAVVRVTE